jgi:hypothetical protein
MSITNSITLRTTDDGIRIPLRAEGLSTAGSPYRDAPLPALPPLHRNLPLHLLRSTRSPPADPRKRRAAYSRALPKLRDREGDRHRGRGPWRRCARGRGVGTHRQIYEPAGGRRALALALAPCVFARHIACGVDARARVHGRAGARGEAR